jgi:hypothetical protein
MPRDTTRTPERDYQRPERGDDWALAWDELVEDLDTNGVYADDTGLSVEDNNGTEALRLDFDDSLTIRDGAGTEALRLEFDDSLTVRDGNGDRVAKLDLNTGDLRLAGDLILNDGDL